MQDNYRSPTIQEGNLIFSIKWANGPENAEFSQIFSQPLGDKGIIEVLSIENRLMFSIFRLSNHSEEIVDQFLTPELIRDQERRFLISLAWKEGHFCLLEINKTAVPRHLEAYEISIPSLEKPKGETPNVIRAPEVNLGRLALPQSLDVRHLVSQYSRLNESLASLRSGSFHHLGEVAGVLRTLFCGIRKNGGKLIFRCADEVGIVPVCFTAYAGDSSHVSPPPDFAETVTIICDAAPFPDGAFNVETQVSDWIERPALFLYSDTPKSHWELIREIAGKVGPHADSNLGEYSVFESKLDKGLNLGVLNQQFLVYGEIALEVSRTILNHPSIRK